eukprot:TRINITY_DN4407_c0_g2_i1.p1 TRINITY_DN4407_c0_g2~~TRINITY_DN4407_c0_g2_i1.p1  ORF type:complete len:378 (+),score=83.11 TRINITY_DN4407_c0_g2_i1:103-1134(+)
METFPVVDIKPFLDNPTSPEGVKACEQVAESLKRTSIVIIRDPRVTSQDNGTFIDMLEQYFSQPFSDIQPDIRADISYQLGTTPELIELPRDHSALMASLPEGSKAHPPVGPDPKCRFFWRIGDRPKETQFGELNAPPVIPKNFPQWEETMNRWGHQILTSVTTVASMLGVGLGFDAQTFPSYMENAPHLLAPTATDLNKYGALGTIYAGFHYDLNFLTIHGKSRFPGLFVWLRDLQKLSVKVPDGCLLVQAGKQAEWLTGGRIKAGFHEVLCTEQTLAAIEQAKQEGRPLWRISSTLFSHVASDKHLEPLPAFADEESLKQWPRVLAGDQVRAELKQIKLGA